MNKNMLRSKFVKYLLLCAYAFLVPFHAWNRPERKNYIWSFNSYLKFNETSEWHFMPKISLCYKQQPLWFSCLHKDNQKQFKSIIHTKLTLNSVNFTPQEISHRVIVTTKNDITYVHQLLFTAVSLLPVIKCSLLKSLIDFHLVKLHRQDFIPHCICKKI